MSFGEENALSGGGQTGREVELERRVVTALRGARGQGAGAGGAGGAGGRH
jgi:hypothetical protein